MRTLLVDSDAQWMARNIQECNPDCQIVGAYSDAKTRFSDIQAMEPDVAFISLDMLEIDGFQLAKQLLKKGCEVIMISEWTTFAYEALRSGVADYLMKPCSKLDLQSSFQRVLKKVKEKTPSLPEKKEFELQNLREYTIPGHVTLSSEGTVNVVSIHHILRYEVKKKHSLVVLENGQMLNLICDTHLLEQQLLTHQFVYASPQCLFNPEKVDRFLPSSKSLVMADGVTIKVSKAMQKSVFQK